MSYNDVQSDLSSWPRVRIGDVAEVFDGPHATPTKTAAGPVFLGISALNRGRLDLSNIEHLSEDEFVKWTRRVTPKPGDVVFSYETRIGEAAIIPEGLRCCLGRRMGLVRTNPSKLDPYFFLYQYLSPAFQDFLTSRTIHGSTVDRIALKEFPDFEIDLPSLFVQRQVAKVMREIDAKIDLNRRINQTLEAMAQAIFKSWFVDFDPVKAKVAAIQEGRDPLRAAMSAISGKSDAELDALPHEIFEQLAATSALFPDEMEDSELGAIPKGWEVRKVEYVSDKIAMGPFGSNIKVETFVDAGVPIISGQHLKETLLTDAEYNHITEEHSEKLANSIVSSGDIIFTHAGNIGQVSLIPNRSRFKKYVISQRQFYLRPDIQKITSSYLVYFFRCPLGQNLLLANASQVGVPSISRPSSYLKSIEILVPRAAVLTRLDEIAAGYFDQTVLLRQQNESLIAIRDTLLPRLLSGELSVTEAIAEAEG